jgi:hypothetical protein
MSKTTIFAIGTGASGKFLEELARLGIKRFFLFDPDIVERHNLVAQNFRADDIGRLKVDALKERLEQIEFERDNPTIPRLEVMTGKDFLAVADRKLDELIDAEQAMGNRPVFLFMTDAHLVQARGSRIALKYQVPTFWVGVYRGGGAGEIVFWLPGFHGLPCYRCITAPRYAHYDKAAVKRQISAKSSGLPFATSLLDSILGHLVIGGIHYGDQRNPHGRLLSRLLRERRNFVQVQLDPEYRLGGEDIFDQIDGPDMVCFNTLFQIDGAKATCPDCGSRANWTATDYTRGR